MPRSCSFSRAVLLVAAALTARPALADPGLIEDQAGLMAAAQRARLSDYHAHLLGDYDIDYRVVTSEKTGDINAYAAERFAALGVGESSRTARGLLLVIDPARNLVRLEVGYALEGVFPDAFIAYIEHRQMVPFFRVARVADGILAATELIVDRARNAEANAGFENEVWIGGSGGGGATAAARLGAGADRALRQDGANVAAGRSPEDTLLTYLRLLQDRNASADLAIYTPETRDMLQGWVMTPAQMDNVIKTYRRCHPEPARYDRAGDLAVIRYPVGERQCAPWFFRRIDGAWALDLTMMQRAIRFGRSNAWRFDTTVEQPYAYAFRDWRFDRNGFPTGP